MRKSQQQISLQEMCYSMPVTSRRRVVTSKLRALAAGWHATHAQTRSLSLATMTSPPTNTTTMQRAPTASTKGSRTTVLKLAGCFPAARTCRTNSLRSRATPSTGRHGSRPSGTGRSTCRAAPRPRTGRRRPLQSMCCSLMGRHLGAATSLCQPASVRATATLERRLRSVPSPFTSAGTCMKGMGRRGGGGRCSSTRQRQTRGTSRPTRRWCSTAPHHRLCVQQLRLHFRNGSNLANSTR
mmetsp:Transcript_9762/g.19738  ORF Transcript_9762/g.19738 Transcript_9762/m.19738 type:complete len:240 (-) Transcript_9762:70-789(-)